jgi:hypothetical protein
MKPLLVKGFFFRTSLWVKSIDLFYIWLNQCIAIKRALLPKVFTRLKALNLYMDSDNYEIVVRPGIIACPIDKQVLKKANDLGILAELVAMKEGETVKVIVANQVFHKSDNTTISNVYAVINFKNSKDGGYAYIKILDIANNTDKLPFFIEAIEKSGGGKFSEAYFKERFFPNNN